MIHFSSGFEKINKISFFLPPPPLKKRDWLMMMETKFQRYKNKHNNKYKFQKWLIYIGEKLGKVMLKNISL